MAKKHYDNYQPHKPIDEPKEDERNYDLQSELEKKFDELFGTDDDDDE